MSNDFFCKICGIACTGKAPYEQHISSTKHIKNAKLNESLTPTKQSTPISSPLSVTTTTTTTGASNIFEDSSTINSSSIKISPETMRILLEWNHPLGYKPYCDICYLPLHGGDNADIHFNSNNITHTKKLAAWKRIQEADAKYSCTVCSELFSNENEMRDHFHSDSHGDAIERKNNLQKFIEIYKTYDKLLEVRMEKKDQIDVSTNSHINNEDLSNRFEKLNVIDGTESPKPKQSKPGLIDQQKFLNVLQIAKKNANNDDDDDD